MNNLLFSMSEFVESTAGGIVFGVLSALLLIAVIELNYKVFAKTVLDYLFALLLIILTSPVMLVLALISKKREGRILTRKTYLGKHGKIIYVHSFAGIKRGICKLARLFDVLCGRLSFVGVSLMEVNDGAFMDDNQMLRFSAKPGLVNHLVLSGYAGLTYEEAFVLDIKYAKHRELFKDIFIILKRGVLALRGDGRVYLGETEIGYGEILLSRGEISQNDFEKSLQLADDAKSRSEKREEFKKQKRS